MAGGGSLGNIGVLLHIEGRDILRINGLNIALGNLLPSHVADHIIPTHDEPDQADVQDVNFFSPGVRQSHLGSDFFLTLPLFRVDRSVKIRTHLSLIQCRRIHVKILQGLFMVNLTLYFGFNIVFSLVFLFLHFPQFLIRELEVFIFFRNSKRHRSSQNSQGKYNA